MHSLSHKDMCNQMRATITQGLMSSSSCTCQIHAQCMPAPPTPSAESVCCTAPRLYDQALLCFLFPPPFPWSQLCLNNSAVAPATSCAATLPEPFAGAWCSHCGQEISRRLQGRRKQCQTLPLHRRLAAWSTTAHAHKCHMQGLSHPAGQMALLLWQLGVSYLGMLLQANSIFVGRRGAGSTLPPGRTIRRSMCAWAWSRLWPDSATASAPGSL